VLNVNSIGDRVCRPNYREALLAHFRPHVESLSADSRRRLERNPLRLLDSKASEDKPYVDSAPTFEDILCGDCRTHFEAVKRYLIALGIPFVVNPRIVRGLDYYTRTVFEFISGSLGAQSTVCAGGRYDDLVASLGGPDVPSVGFGLGLERFLMVVEAAGGTGEPARAGVQAVALGADARERLVALVAQIRRAANLPVFMDYEERKVAAQLKIADRNNARYALILGSNELAEGTIVLRDLVSRTDRSLPLATGKDVVAALVEVER
jgi:histidyl-tRNA synthetase